MEEYVKLMITAREQGLLNDSQARAKLKRIKRESQLSTVEYDMINKQLAKCEQDYVKRSKLSFTAGERLTEHLRISCHFVLNKLKQIVKDTH